MTDAFAKAPIVLVLDDEEWRARSLESVLQPGGFAVLKVFTARQAVEMVRRVRPDVVIVEHRVADATAVEALALLRREGDLPANTPIFVTAPAELGRQDHLDLLQAGAWDVLRAPLDAEQLLVRTKTYLGAKQEADRAREENLFDSAIGCYGVKGLLRRVDELAADAYRHRRPLACLVLSGGPREEEGARAARAAELRPLADFLNSTVRISDIVACVGEGEFVVLAPGTGANGARQLAERILTGLDARPAAGDPALLRAGIFAGDGDEEEEIPPVEILRRARAALRLAQEAANRGARIHLHGDRNGNGNGNGGEHG